MAFAPPRPGKSQQSRKIDPRKLAESMGKAVLKSFIPGGVIKDRFRRDAADSISNELYVSLQENMADEVNVLGEPTVVGNIASIPVRLRDPQGNQGLRKQRIHIIVEDDGEWDGPNN